MQITYYYSKHLIKLKKHIYFLVLIGLLLFIPLYWLHSQRMEVQNSKNVDPNIDQEVLKKYKGVFAFYNVENLFDTIDDKHIRDNEFLPSSTKNWNTEKYFHKCKRIASLIDSLDIQLNMQAMGLCEIENEKCLNEVLNFTKNKWKYLYFNTSDTRGIDQAFLYNESYIKVLQNAVLQSNAESENHFREIGFAKVKIQSDTVVFLVHHWPSRMGGTYKSDPKRMAAAKRLNKIVDSLYALHINKIIVMADFNDEPQDLSIQQLKNCENITLVNLFESLKSQGEGTIQFKSQKYLFDQILITPELSQSKGKAIKFTGAGIYHPSWLHYKNDINLGPYRTFNSQKYHGGYSDHFPVYIELK